MGDDFLLAWVLLCSGASQNQSQVVTWVWQEQMELVPPYSQPLRNDDGQQGLRARMYCHFLSCFLKTSVFNLA